MGEGGLVGTDCSQTCPFAHKTRSELLKSNQRQSRHTGRAHRRALFEKNNNYMLYTRSAFTFMHYYTHLKKLGR